MLPDMENFPPYKLGYLNTILSTLLSLHMYFDNLTLPQNGTYTFEPQEVPSVSAREELRTSVAGN